jgi:thiosulfate dehydrogenase (quinone) large subunit
MLTRYRSFAVPLAIVAAAVLFYMVNPWFFPAVGSTERGVASIVFWVLMILVLALLFEDRKAPQAETVEVEGPAFTRYLFSNTRAGLIWLPIRLFLGFEWLTAGWDKLTGTGWVDGGASLLGYWKGAVAVPTTGHAAITFEWYRSFLQLLINNNAQTWFGWLITLGELAIGVGLLLGVLTGIAAFFGATMNMSYLLAGSTSTNPVMFAFAIGLILAWKVAGYYGVDRYLLPRLGVPWGTRPGRGNVPPAVIPVPAS